MVSSRSRSRSDSTNTSKINETQVSLTTNGTKRKRNTDSESSVKMPIKQSRRSLNIDLSFLKKHLKHLKSVQQVSKKINCDENVENDRKMYRDVPYVLIVKDDKQKSLRKISAPAKSKARPKSKSKPRPKSKQQNDDSSDDASDKLGGRRSSRINKPLEVIELSDTESESRIHKENRKPVKVKSQKKTNVKPKSTKQSKKVKNKLSAQKKIPFKIRLSSKFIVPPGSVEQKKTYVCNICDKRFNVNCTFKVHKLWHEKPETVVINITRHNLSDKIKTSEPISNKLLKKKFKIISDVNINSVITNKELDNNEEVASDANTGTEQLDDATNGVSSSENSEEIMDSSSTEQHEEVQIQENGKSDDVEQSKTPDKQAVKPSLEERNSDAEESEHEITEKAAEETSQEVNSKEINETSDEEKRTSDKEEVEDDSQKEINGQEEVEEENDKGSKETEEANDDNNENTEVTTKTHEQDVVNEEAEDNDVENRNNDVEKDNQEDYNKEDMQNAHETENSDVNFSDADNENESEDDHVDKRDSIEEKVEIIEKQLAVMHGEAHIANRNISDEYDEPLALIQKRMNKSDVSDNEENTSSNEKITPKTKRVRFATDYDSPNDEPLDLNISTSNYSEEKNENLGKSWCSV